MLDDLETILAELYDTSAKARHVLARAGISAARIDLGGAARVFWHNILAEASSSHQLVDLLRVTSEDYPHRPELKQIYEAYAYALDAMSKVSEATGDWQVSERHIPYDYIVRLEGRVSALETNLPQVRLDIQNLGENQARNREWTDRKFDEVTTLIKGLSVQPKPRNDRQFLLMIIIGGIVTATFLLMLGYIIYSSTGGRVSYPSLNSLGFIRADWLTSAHHVCLAILPLRDFLWLPQ